MNLRQVCLFTLLIFLFQIVPLGFTGEQSEQEPPVDEEASPPSTNAANISTFALKTDDLVDTDKSVNLFTGDLSLPLNLVSLSGRNGLDVNVTIQYSSNIHNVVNKWNLEAPTGILGLGWSMDYDKITVDHKNTGTREDDDFYLVTNGSSNLLIRVGYQNDNPREYKLKKYEFWTIHYYFNEYDERWEIIKEDGITYVYGDKKSGRNTVQYGLKWGNWIGSSTESSSEKFALEWNLSEIIDTWGNKVTYKYKEVKSVSGASEASYVKEIVDSFKRKVVFNYDKKYGASNVDYQNGRVEYIKPHVGNAYQDRYEKEFLDYIDVFDSDNQKMFSIDFDYDFLQYKDKNGAVRGDIVKRLLSSITQKDAHGNSLPSMEFKYSGHESDNTVNPKNKGALRMITYPHGGNIRYYYKDNVIQRSDRKITLEQTGYEKPWVWCSQDYVVVTWHKKTSIVNDGYKVGDLRVIVYTWDGEWIEKKLADIPNVEYRADAETHNYPDWDRFTVSLEKDHFALIVQKNEIPEKRDRIDIYMWHRSPFDRSGWEYYCSEGTSEGMPLYVVQDYKKDWDLHDHAQLVTGDDFVAVSTTRFGENSESKGNFRLYQWNGSGWKEEILLRRTDGWNGTQTYQRFFICGTNNYLIFHDRKPTDILTDRWEKIFFYYRDETGVWHEPQQLPDNTTFWLDEELGILRQSPWLCNNNFAMALPERIVTTKDNAKACYLYNWDENYQYFIRNGTDYFKQARYNNGSAFKGDIYESILTLSSWWNTYENENGVTRAWRWNGNMWKGTIFTQGSTPVEFIVGIGNDFLITRSYTQYDQYGGFDKFDLERKYIKRWEYDPNNNDWHKELAGDGTWKAVPSEVLPDREVDPYWEPEVSVCGDAYAWSTFRPEKRRSDPNGMVYKRKPDGEWCKHRIEFPEDYNAEVNAIKMGNNFYAYEFGHGGEYMNLWDFSVEEIRIGQFKNGEWINCDPLYTDHRLHGVFGNTIVTHNGNVFSSGTNKFEIRNADKICLYRFVNDAADGVQIDYPVVKIEVDDGYQTTYTSFNYITENVIYDASGTVAKYWKVDVIPGSVDGISKPYGYTEQCFFNGLFFEESNPYCYNYISVDDDKYKLLEGRIYYTKSISQIEKEITSTKYCWWNGEKIFDDKYRCYYIRARRIMSFQDGVTSEREFTYNPDNGLTMKTTEYNSDEELWITERTYAFEKYDEEIYGENNMKYRNMLSQVVQQTVYEDGESDSDARSSSVTTWKKDWNGKEVWAPCKTYQWLEDDGEDNYGLPTFNFTSWSDTDEPDPNDYDEREWIRTSKILKRDDYGNAVEEKDANGTVTTSKLGYNSTVPVATIVNAKTSQKWLGSECGYAGFESGSTVNQTNPDEDYWGFNSFCKINNVSYTGNYSIKLESSFVPIYGPTKDFLPPDPESQKCTYVASCWVKTEPGFGYNKGALIFHTKRNNDNDNRTYPYIREAYKASLFGDTQGKWIYIKTELDLQEIRDKGEVGDYVNLRLRLYPQSSDASHYMLVDDMRVYPKDALMTTQTYDPQTFQVTSQSDGNSMPFYSRYDGFGRLVETMNADKKLIGYNSYYYSLDGNVGSLSEDPNYIKAMSIPAEGFSDDFEYEDDPVNHGWKKYGSGIMETVYDNTLKSRVLHTETSEGIKFVVKYPSSGDLNTTNPHFFIKIKCTNNFILLFYVSTKNGKLYSIKYVSVSDTTSVNSDIYNVLDSKYFSGKWQVLQQDIRKDLENEGLEFKSVRYFCILGNFDLDYVRLTGHPITSVTYTNGIGRSFQTQTWEGDNDIITKTAYNEIGKVGREYKPKSEYNSGHKYFNLTGNYPFITYTYHNDPLARPYQIIHPDSSGTLTNEYSKEEFTIDGTKREYRFEKIIDEGQNVNKKYFDIFGNEVGGFSGGSEKSISWSNVYDILGNVKFVQPPNYRNGPRGVPDDWDTEIKYNTMGQVIEKTTPDEGLTKCIYDRNNNLVYSQNEHQADPARNDFTVRYYDANNRVIHIGEEKDQGWSYNLNPYTKTYGTGDTEWKVKYSYDINQIDSEENYCQGRMTMAEVNDDSDKRADQVIRYLYDKFGNVIQKWIMIDEGEMISEKIISYKYDQLGRETRIEYPSRRMVFKKYDDAGRLKNIFSIIDDYSGVFVKVRIFLEGPYDEYGEMSYELFDSGKVPKTSPYGEDSQTVSAVPEDVVDWVLVQLRNSPDGSIIGSKSAFLDFEGNIISIDGRSKILMHVPEGSYYVVIKHRNHLPVMSSFPVSLNSESSVLYDFTTGADKFYGSKGVKKLESGVYGMIAGDIDGSGSIGASDRIAVYNNSSLSGYNNSDCNLDGYTDTKDSDITSNNKKMLTGVP